MELLERETHLRELHRALEGAAGGRGQTVFVTGEAGIGKTSLVEQFADEAGGRAHFLWGACEAFFTPHPLGPFYDIAYAMGGPLLAQVKRSAKPVDLFHSLFDTIRSCELPPAIVIEDAHWADHGTLDFVKFLARRIGKVPALLVLTYRDDEVGADHPLAATLGELSADARLRLKLPALSREAVEHLSRDAGRTLPDLYRITAGNPFFVTELLREDSQGVAPTVREAVLSRVRRLSEPARALLNLASVAPDRVELSLLKAVASENIEALDECLERGLLRLDADQVSFRHELVRMAVEEALPAVKRLRLNRQLLEALGQTAIDARTLTRLAHHAIAAGDAQGILRYVPQAARAATERGAQREAVALLSAALPYAKGLPVGKQAEFHESRVGPHIAVGQNAEAIDASLAAYKLWDELGDDLAKGRNLVRRLRFPWIVRNLGAHPAASPVAEVRRIAHDAIALLERYPPGGELAFAYATLATFAPLEQAAVAAAYRKKAADMAERHCSVEDLPEVLARIVRAEWSFFGVARESTLQRLTRHAKEVKSDQRQVTAYQYAAESAFAARQLDTAEHTIREGLRFAEDRQLDDFWPTHSLRLTHAAIAAARGHWDYADAQYQALLQRPTLPQFLTGDHIRMQSALLAARRGRSTDWGRLREALEHQADNTVRTLYILHRSYAEIAWLAGHTEEAQRSADVAWRIVTQWEHCWFRGEVAVLRLLLGQSLDDPGELAEPYARQLSGDYRAAAETWRRLGYPFEQALALIFGDEDAQRESLHVLDRLGAKAVAERARERMRASGIRRIPRGPIRSTKSNPLGLTERELEVLGLLADGLSNSSIATRIRRSVKTVDHHVSAVIGKLGASTRMEAVAIARRRSVIERNG